MKLKAILIFVAIGFVIFLHSCTKENAELKFPKNVAFCGTITFSHHVKPILDLTCSKGGCHDGTNGHGNYKTYDGVHPYVANNNLFNHVLVLKDMPQGGPPLTETELSTFDCWLKAGAPNN